MGRHEFVGVIPLDVVTSLNDVSIQVIPIYVDEEMDLLERLLRKEW